MVKLVELLKRREGLSREEFSTYWREQHGPLAIKVLPGVKRYVQNHSVSLPGRGEPKFDGMVELWFDDLEAQRECARWYASDEAKFLRDDEARFVDGSKTIYFVVEEHLIES